MKNIISRRGTSPAHLQVALLGGRFLKLNIFLLLLIFSTTLAGAIEFSYKYNTGDKYRILSTVNEDIYVNYKLGYKSEIINRIAVEITGTENGKGRHEAVFQTAEKTTKIGGTGVTTQPTLFEWSRDYPSKYEQTNLGYISIGSEYYMPMVRDVPVFPERELYPGDTWSAAGEEVHDFRDSFGIKDPYRIPFTAEYTYLGEAEWKGEKYPAFTVSYSVLFNPPPVSGNVFPRRIQQSSQQTIYWDIDHGQVAAYEEHFRTIIHLSDGQVYEYRGRAEAEVIESPPMNKEEIINDIKAEIENIPDASVRVSDEGIVISLENIQFAPDSSILMASEKLKLDSIAEILMKYPDRDLLVGGHTALAGNAAGRLQLSLERAQAVADYLLGKRVRTPERMVIQGYGAERPVADNSTEEGMRKNRRVEITILEN
ncbi:MAG: OmpA family protein [Treponema sp.]|nr:OmpA family protein [Treponema sp.]